MWRLRLRVVKPLFEVALSSHHCSIAWNPARYFFLKDSPGLEPDKVYLSQQQRYLKSGTKYQRRALGIATLCPVPFKLPLR